MQGCSLAHRPSNGNLARILTGATLCADWWAKPDFVINELNVQSVITAPAHDELVLMQAAGNYTVKGFAYSGL